MIQAAPSAIYRAEQLNRFDWLDHGFGTRHSHWPEAERLATLRQIHSTVVIEASAPGPQGEGDALVTNEPGLMIGVKTADCVPILLVDSRNRAVAAVHAGWKGTAHEIVLRVLEAMGTQYATDPADVYAAIGPCIQACCYEVGPEVVERFREWLPLSDLTTRQKIDLVEANRRQLIVAGLPEWRIDSGAPCTFCKPAELYSFRREGQLAGRMISAIGIR